MEKPKTYNDVVRETKRLNPSLEYKKVLEIASKVYEGMEKGVDGKKADKKGSKKKVVKKPTGKKKETKKASGTLSYKACLAKVKEVYPYLDEIDQKKLASSMHRQGVMLDDMTLKSETDNSIKPSATDENDQKEKDNLSDLYIELDKKINSNASTINEVKAILVAANLIEHEIIKDGKRGANTLIHVELLNGKRLPDQGSYVVFN